MRKRETSKTTLGDFQHATCRISLKWYEVHHQMLKSNYNTVIRHSSSFCYTLTQCSQIQHLWNCSFRLHADQVLPI